MRIVHFILARGGSQVIVRTHTASPTAAWCMHDLQEWPCDALRLEASRWPDDPAFDPAWSLVHAETAPPSRS